MPNRETVPIVNQPDSSRISKLMADLVLLNRQIGAVFHTNGTFGLLGDEDQTFGDELNAQKDHYINELLEARANGDASLRVIILMFPGEQLHPWSRNNFVLELPHPTIEGGIYPTRSNLYNTATYRGEDSQSFLGLLQKGDPPLQEEEETVNNFVVRKFYEMETITGILRAKRKDHNFKEATQLQDLATEQAIGILQLRDNKRKGVDPQTIIPIRVGLVRDSRRQAAVEVKLRFEYTYDRGETDHSFFIPIPAQQKMKYKDILRRLLVPYDFIEEGRFIPFAS